MLSTKKRKLDGTRRFDGMCGPKLVDLGCNPRSQFNDGHDLEELIHLLEKKSSSSLFPLFHRFLFLFSVQKEVHSYNKSHGESFFLVHNNVTQIYAFFNTNFSLTFKILQDWVLEIMWLFHYGLPINSILIFSLLSCDFPHRKRKFWVHPQ